MGAKNILFFAWLASAAWSLVGFLIYLIVQSWPLSTHQIGAIPLIVMVIVGLIVAPICYLVEAIEDAKKRKSRG